MQKLNTDAGQNGIDTTLFDRYAATILAYLCQQVANQQDAEDLLVEVFMAAHHHAHSDLSEERQLAWLRRVARNKVIDRYRHSALLTMLPLEHLVETEDSALTPEERVVQQENYKRLYLALAQLSPLQQQLIHLRYGNGLRLVAIAEIFEKPEGSVRKMLARTLRQLRTHYEKAERDTKNEAVR
ncbi:MAG TPA: RNA polymerase sigma factor [Ktedonobacteraceae bacterium]|nr:RNA polymerase sigma factor [Ktedonobacteraceae bacterium]